MRLRLVAIAAVVGTAAAPRAHADPPRALSLHEAIAYARAHQPSLAAARARADVARAQAGLPGATRAPRITAGAELLLGTNNNTTASYGGPLGFDVPRIGGTPANAPRSYTPEPSTLVGIGVRQELYDFGRTRAQEDALDLFARAASDAADAQALDVTLYVSDVFYVVVAARDVLRASDASATRAREHRDYAHAKVGAQLWPPIEDTRAEAEVARREVDRVRAEASLVAAQQRLAAAIGAPDAAIDAGADDLDLAAPLVPAAIDPRALAADPAVRAATDAARAQHAQTAAIATERRPDLSLSASLSARAGGADVAANPSPTGDGWLPDVANYDAIVVASWPIFDRTVDARAEASRRAERARAAEADAVLANVRGAASEAFAAFEATARVLPALVRARDAARANQAAADARFRAGLGTAVELADAEALLADADVQLAIGELQRSRARARIARVTREAPP